MQQRLLLTPADPGFWEIYHSTPPPGERTQAFYVVDSQTFELKNVDGNGLVDYIYGGEYDVLENYWEASEAAA